jgi:hypothetical protein
MMSACNLIESDGFLPTAREHKEAYEDSVSYAKMVISTRTVQEKSDYEKICQRMLACTSRPPGAEKLAKNAGWSRKLRDDNWWHCRRIL